MQYNECLGDTAVKLYYNKQAKDPAYYGQQTFRNGKKVSSKTVKYFGKHSELLKITPDPLAYVQEEVRKWNEEHRVGRSVITLTTDLNELLPETGSDIPQSKVLNIGYFFIQYILAGLKLKKFFQIKTTDRKITFDCYDIHRFLTYARILNPQSKFATLQTLNTYYEKPNFDYQHILRFMDVLEENYDDYLRWLYKESNSVVKRDTSVLYYDCTNFYFECDEADEDYVDEVTGEVIKGLRKYGFGKQHQPKPLVEMGLFMDKRGIPITMCIHSGNTSEQLTAIPLEDEILKMLPNEKFIYCSDGGLGSYNIRKFNSMGGRSFIVTQSLKKVSKILQKTVFTDSDYRLLSNDSSVSVDEMKSFDKFDKTKLGLYNDSAYKVIEADKIVDLGTYEEKTLADGSKVKVKVKDILKQRLIVTFSRKTMEYQRTVRNQQIERVKKLLELKNPEEIKKGPNDVKRFMRRIITTKSGETAEVTYELDKDKIAEEEKYDGFYAIATNLTDPAKEIIAVSSKRYLIEECFKIMKTNFNGRPVYHRLPDRIRAHFLLCYTALLVYRLLEAKLDDQGAHVTTNQLITTMKTMNVVNVHDVEYMATFTGCSTISHLTKLTNLSLNYVYYGLKELDKMIKKLLK